MLEDCAGQTCPVGRSRSFAELIYDDEALAGGEAQGDCDLLDVYHEGALDLFNLETATAGGIR